MGALSDAVSYFTGRGWSREQAAGIVGNLDYESGGFNPAAVGDGGKAYGLAQWHPDRQTLFERIFGKPLKGATIEDQLAFVDWELRNTEKGAGQALAGASTVGDATRVFMGQYERPASMASVDDRTARAAASIGSGVSGYGLGDVLGTIFGWGAETTKNGGNPAGAAILDQADAGISGWFGWLASFFNGQMAGRFAAVIVGIVLVGLAIAALTLTSDTGKTVISVAKKGLPA